MLLALMWIVEAARVPHVLFGEAPDFNWPRVLIRSAIMLFIWLIVHVTTKRLLQRLHELEEFLLICAWCRRVGHEDQWLHFEQFFDSRFSTATSHGICPDCARQFMASGAAASPRCDAVRPSSPPP